MHKIGFLVDRRYLKQEITTTVTAALVERGASVDLICPQDCQFEPGLGQLRNQNGILYQLDRYDVLVPRTRSALGLALLSYAQAAHIPIINGYAAIQKARSKSEVAVTLAHAGIRSAPTILTDDAGTLAKLPQNWYPLILKAVYGDNSQGLRLIRKPEELDLVTWNDDLVLAQHFVPNDGFDLKLYASGKTVFACRKASPFNTSPAARLQRIEPDPEMARLVLQVGAVLDLGIYGVDAIETPEGPIVIEVNDFPNFTGIQGAADGVADYIMARTCPPLFALPPILSSNQPFTLYAPAGV